MQKQYILTEKEHLHLIDKICNLRDLIKKLPNNVIGENVKNLIGEKCIELYTTLTK